MTPEEKDLIKQIRSEDEDLQAREKAIKRLGELLKEGFILDFSPSPRVLQELKGLAGSRTAPPGLRRTARSLVQTYSR